MTNRGTSIVEDRDYITRRLTTATVLGGVLEGESSGAQIGDCNVHSCARRRSLVSQVLPGQGNAESHAEIQANTREKNEFKQIAGSENNGKPLNLSF